MISDICLINNNNNNNNNNNLIQTKIFLLLKINLKLMDKLRVIKMINYNKLDRK